MNNPTNGELRHDLSAICAACGKSYGEHDYDDCLNGRTRFQMQAAPPAEPNNRVDPTACPECIGMGCEKCNGTGEAAGANCTSEPCGHISDCTTPKLCLSVGTCKGRHVMPAAVRASAGVPPSAQPQQENTR